MSSEGRRQPPWNPPQARLGAQLPQLRIYNSLTRRKDDFVPIDPAGKIVTWYACGPTVYEDSHLGHAKNYVATDIIRRILKDYFGFRVRFVMNTTDIDDKIILQGRQQHLLARFKQEHAASDDSVSDSVLAEANAAFQHYLRESLPSLPSDTSPDTFDEAVSKAYGGNAKPRAPTNATATADKHGQPVDIADLKLKAHLRAARSAVEALQAPGKLSGFYAKTDDIFLPYLDALHGAEIDSNNHEIYLQLTRKFERRFFDDMHSLNVLDPDQLTRVTEYVPQIVSFVEKIVANGFGYITSDGSVYFDIESFEEAGHSYCRLEPWNRNNHALHADGEGSLSEGTMKRSANHFALWKASKPGEPAWPSPWGPGRPGWHIECSAMASEVIGKAMDLHSGGVDLRFPHHDNELAQSEAYWSTPDSGSQVQWANYFVHMGQLRIQGLKMSKSLKNFTTIRTVLSQKDWTARSLRICFLLVPWQDVIEVSDELMKTVVAWEGKLNNFFLKSLDLLSHSGSPTTQELRAADQQLLGALEKAKVDTDAALCDSFNTTIVMRSLSGLVTEYNSAEGVSDHAVISLARWITRIVTILGLSPEGDLSNPDRVGWAGLEIPTAAKPYVYPVSQLRDKVRNLACSGSVDHTTIAHLADEVTVAAPISPVVESSRPYDQVLQQFRADVKGLAAQQAPAKDLLALCDQLRDVHLWNLGIYLEDRDSPPAALVRPIDKLLIEARAERESAGAAKTKARLEREAREAERERELRERAKVSHLLMFKTSGEYLEWDADGIPTVDAAGEVSKSRRKKLVKEWERQRKMHEEWLAKRQPA